MLERVRNSERGEGGIIESVGNNKFLCIFGDFLFTFKVFLVVVVAFFVVI